MIKREMQKMINVTTEFFSVQRLKKGEKPMSYRFLSIIIYRITNLMFRSTP